MSLRPGGDIRISVTMGRWLRSLRHLRMTPHVPCQRRNSFRKQGDVANNATSHVRQRRTSDNDLRSNPDEAMRGISQIDEMERPTDQRSCSSQPVAIGRGPYTSTYGHLELPAFRGPVGPRRRSAWTDERRSLRIWLFEIDPVADFGVAAAVCAAFAVMRTQSAPGATRSG